MRRRDLLTGALVAAAIGAGRPVAAESATLRIVRPLSLAVLPLLVMEHEHLIERTAEAMGLGAVAASWAASGETDPLELLTAGKADFVTADLVPFLITAEAGAGSPAAIRALGAVAQRPYVLVTRNPAINTIRDFGDPDRIAVPRLKLSGPAVMLEMAAAQEWGIESYERLSRLAVAQPDAAAAAGLLAGGGGFNAHFSHTPYVDQELANPAIHRVMDSFDIAGAHTAAVLVGNLRFSAANPELCKAVLAALQQAGDLIEKNPGTAAEIFAAMDKSQDLPLEELSDMIGDPDLVYSAAPAGTMRIADFMHRIGRLKRRPADWREFFFSQSRDLRGS
jgi:NitT/TauT family transport system substrate-binding protein